MTARRPAIGETIEYEGTTFIVVDVIEGSDYVTIKAEAAPQLEPYEMAS